MKKLNKTQVNRIVTGLTALLYARHLTLECKKALKDLHGENDLIQAMTVMAYAVPACALITQVFGTGELRDEAYKVLAKLVEAE